MTTIQVFGLVLTTLLVLGCEGSSDRLNPSNASKPSAFRPSVANLSGRVPAASRSSAATSPMIPPQASEPTLEQAIQALRTMVSESNDDALKRTLPDLSLKPYTGTDAPFSDGLIYYFGANWKIRLFERAWSVRVISQAGTWYHYGALSEEMGGPWRAFETSRRGEGSRGG